MVLSCALNFQLGIVTTVRDDKEEEDALDVPHKAVGGSKDLTDIRLKGKPNYGPLARTLAPWNWQGQDRSRMAAKGTEATTCSDEGSLQGLPSSFFVPRRHYRSAR